MKKMTMGPLAVVALDLAEEEAEASWEGLLIGKIAKDILSYFLLQTCSLLHRLCVYTVALWDFLQSSA